MIVNRVLLAVDDSPASTRAAEYVGGFLRTSDSYEVHVLHVLDGVPPFGAEDPASDRRFDRPDLVENEWRRKHARAAQPMLREMSSRLVRAGVRESFIETGVCTPDPLQTVTETILEKAHELGCGTVVVGRTDLPWYRRVLRRHIGDELVRRGDGLSVWVVE